MHEFHGYELRLRNASALQMVSVLCSFGLHKQQILCQTGLSNSLMQAETQLGECMLYNLAEWAKDQIPQWLELSIAERSLPAAVSTAQVQAAIKEVMHGHNCTGH